MDVKKIVLSLFICSVLCFPLCSVSAEESDPSGSFEDALTYILNQDRMQLSSYRDSSNAVFGFRLGKNYPDRTRIVSGLNVQQPDTLYMFSYENSEGWFSCYFVYSSSVVYSYSGLSSLYGSTNILRIDRTTDLLNYQYGGPSGVGSATQEQAYETIPLTSLYRWTDGISYGDYICYGIVQEDPTATGRRFLVSGQGAPFDCPRIHLQDGQDALTVLALFSSHNWSYVPWSHSTSSGGLHFSDGSTLTPSEREQFNEVFLLMDLDYDGSVTENEVITYNNTYNTNYNFVDINNGVSFDWWAFLNYIANNLDESGGGGSAGGGSYTSQQQQQQNQVIENGAINVTVDGGGGINSDNVGFLNQIINGWNGVSAGAGVFQSAISNMRGFINIGEEFSALAGSVFGFLPSWVSGLMSLILTLTGVMAIFRLVHVFV